MTKLNSKKNKAIKTYKYMEKRVNDKIVTWTHDFKLKLKNMIDSEKDSVSIIEFLM